MIATPVKNIFRQDHGRCQSFNGGHDICHFCPHSLPNDVRGSQRRIDEHYGVSSLSKDAVGRLKPPGATEFFRSQSDGHDEEPNYRSFNGQFKHNGRDYGVVAVVDVGNSLSQIFFYL